MIPIEVTAALSLLYFGLLFAIAYYADKRREAGKSIASNSFVYSLSLAVYLTSWSLYGTVGWAARSGPGFLAGYLGPTLIAFSWWFLLRKMVRISKEQNIVSIADFIASRYGKSPFLGGAVTVFALLGIIPYVALQLKAVADTFDLISGHPEEVGRGVAHLIPATPLPIDTAFAVALLLGLFGVLFGARHLDASERHEGLVTAIAVESLVKIVAMVAVGLYVTYGMFDGFSDIAARTAAMFPERKYLLLLGTEQIPYYLWFGNIIVSMTAMMFLPRQFQIMVVENSSEEHIKDAMWRFPAYMLLIAIFIIPIALGGLLFHGGDTSKADYFTIHLPLQTGHPWLAMLVFIGGFSASAGMVMVESVALSSMVLNHLVMPVILRFDFGSRDISKILLGIRRLGIMAVVFFGYLFYKIMGESQTLTYFGEISFLAVIQFAPSMIGGLYWKRANFLGAAVGLVLGFVILSYTIIFPTFVQAGWFESGILENGLFGLTLLRPQELFGLSGFDILTHALFWSIFFNLGSFLLLSVLTEPGKSEADQAVKFVDVFRAHPETVQRTRMSKAVTIVEFVDLMTKFIGEKQAHTAITQYLGDRQIDAKGSMPENELPTLKRFTERVLAGHIGAVPAGIIVDSYLSAKGSGMEDVFDIFASVTLSRTASREQLSVLYEAARMVSSGSDLQTVQDNILELLRQQFKFDLCVIRILDEKMTCLTVRSQKGMSSEHLDESDRELNLETYAGEAFLTNSVMVVNDTDFMEKPLSARTIRREEIRSFAHAPITIEGNAVGVLSAFSKSMKGIFTDEFVALFENLARQIGIAWRNAHQTEKLIEAKKQEKELQIARTIQLGLLPTSAPAVRNISLTGKCIPAREVGGDYYDFLPRGDSVLDLVIADVSGHNVGAALMMTETRTFIQSRVQDIESPGKMMSALNGFLFNDLSGAELFITMFYLHYNAGTRELSFASAGHNPPVLWRGKTRACERLDAEGLILGISREVDFEEKLERLQPGDILLLFTDGITEAENQAGEFFGEERLCTLLEEHHTLAPQQIIDQLIRQLQSFTGTESFTDDVTLVIMRVEG